LEPLPKLDLFSGTVPDLQALHGSPSLSLPAKHSNSASGYKNERISLYDLTFLPFELYLHKHHVFPASSSSENQKAVEFFKCRFLRKKDGPSPMKMSLFV
jgi:hypothetical protein